VASGNWSDGSNWSGGVPVSGSATVTNYTNGARFTNSAPLTWDGGTNTSAGSLTVNSTATVQFFQSNGTITVNPGGVLANRGSDLVLGGGSTTENSASAAGKFIIRMTSETPPANNPGTISPPSGNFNGNIAYTWPTIQLVNFGQPGGAVVNGNPLIPDRFLVDATQFVATNPTALGTFGVSIPTGSVAGSSTSPTPPSPSRPACCWRARPPRAPPGAAGARRVMRSAATSQPAE
jgi:hypothetical protein